MEIGRSTVACAAPAVLALGAAYRVEASAKPVPDRWDAAAAARYLDARLD